MKKILLRIIGVTKLVEILEKKFKEKTNWFENPINEKNKKKKESLPLKDLLSE